MSVLTSLSNVGIVVLSMTLIFINAALNIAALGLSVNQPEVPGIACLLERQLSLFPTGGTFRDKAYSAFGIPNRCK
ncbi:hypothetical protein [Nostoc sp. LEGE 12447]|uniref:hypothetical protein n=1 Tax=Nostoc sp. LEGE 12447 TaxID=1828640 RepID=UPI001D15B312|nr:hypothetical protein [Nostoc sp. LEGE 12447]